jgi:hypothetical protein
LHQRSKQMGPQQRDMEGKKGKERIDQPVRIYSVFFISCFIMDQNSGEGFGRTM